MKRLYRYIITPSRKQLLLETLRDARTYEEWEAAALQVDHLLRNDLWREDLQTKAYDFQLIRNRTRQITDALASDDIFALAHTLRSTLVRNLANITAPKLYNRAYAGTKRQIEVFAFAVAQAVQYITAHKYTGDDCMTNQGKMDFLHDARQSFGRSCLVLQGGSIFGLCHLGVVKALYLQDLLPRIIAGTATGALMAALVGVHTDHELLHFLSSDTMNLEAFAAASERDADAAVSASPKLEHNWVTTLVRRAGRFFNYGLVLEPRVLEECVRANVGDMTFEEAFNHTKRVLNITISVTESGVPSLLNYVTAPNVLIWSAALVSNAVDLRKSPVGLLCKRPDGSIGPWDIVPKTYRPLKNGRATPGMDRRTPLARIAQMHNVNHYIISQARPYIAPFLAPTSHHSNAPRYSRESWSSFALRLFSMEIQHRLTQLSQLGLLGPSLSRLLLDESVPNSSWTLVPEVGVTDFIRLLRNPTRKEVDYWMLRGERSVWPAITALRIRCGVEKEIDHGYQSVRRRKPLDFGASEHLWTETDYSKTNRRRTRQRAASMGAA